MFVQGTKERLECKASLVLLHAFQTCAENSNAKLLSFSLQFVGAGITNLMLLTLMY